MKHIIVIGKRELTQLEIVALQTIGYGIAHAGNQLHTTDTPGAPAVVAHGFREAGGTPELHTSGLGKIEGETIVFLDEQLAAKLDQQMPDWETKGWVVLQDEQHIVDWASAMVTTFEELGNSMVAM